MSEELKSCPFCGSEAGIPTNLDGTPVDYEITDCCCKNDDCPLADYWTPIKIWQTRPIEDDLRKRIAELEEQVWNLNLENERMEEAYWIDESIAPDGTLKPSVRKLLERLEKAETDLRLSDDLVKALDNRIAELEEKQRWRDSSVSESGIVV